MRFPTRRSLILLTVTLPGCSDTSTTGVTTPTHAREATSPCTGIPASVHISPFSITLQPGQVYLSAAANVYDGSGCPVNYNNHPVGWTSRNSAVATATAVPPNFGEITGVSVGETWVVAQSGTARDSIRVSVVPPSVLTSIVLTPNPAATHYGRHAYFTANGKDQYGNPIATGTLTWTVDQTAIATIDASGVATGTGLGTTTVRARTSNGVTGTASLSINPTVRAYGPAEAYDETVTVTSTVSPSGGTYYFEWYVQRCAASGICDQYAQFVAQGYNVRQASVFVSRYDRSVTVRVGIRNSPGGPLLDGDDALILGGRESGGSTGCAPGEIIC